MGTWGIFLAYPLQYGTILSQVMTTSEQSLVLFAHRTQTIATKCFISTQRTASEALLLGVIRPKTFWPKVRAPLSQFNGSPVAPDRLRFRKKTEFRDLDFRPSGKNISRLTRFAPSHIVGTTLTTTTMTATMTATMTTTTTTAATSTTTASTTTTTTSTLIEPRCWAPVTEQVWCQLDSNRSFTPSCNYKQLRLFLTKDQCQLGHGLNALNHFECDKIFKNHR